MSKKDIFALLSRPVPFDDGYKEVWLDRVTGRVCMAISAKGMAITGIDDRRYWNRVATEESFHIVAYLLQIWWFEVDGVVKFPLPADVYTLSFRIHLGRFSKRLGRRVSSFEHTHGWDIKPVRFELSTTDGQLASCECYLDDMEQDYENRNHKRGCWIEYKNVIMGPVVSADWSATCDQLLGTVLNKFRGSQIEMRWLEDNFQTIEASDLDDLHKINLRGRLEEDWPTFHKKYIEMWERRHNDKLYLLSDSERSRKHHRWRPKRGSINPRSSDGDAAGLTSSPSVSEDPIVMQPPINVKHHMTPHHFLHQHLLQGYIMHDRHLPAILHANFANNTDASASFFTKVGHPRNRRLNSEGSTMSGYGMIGFNHEGRRRSQRSTPTCMLR
ncbi:hypothetical protein GOBAR_AA27986 [Gossypium barbadense]|uniref:Uncharacterized protein n=1 Tax=Gossypium barbadense TaxID=3634 RepID=A0A2P5WNM0_GOSBA|nr:hypothetical protein GOBAR_AA27986 [Gossypium barbadense]